MLSDKIAGRADVFNFRETIDSRRRVIANYRMGQRVAQTIRSTLKEKRVRLIEAKPTKYLTGDIDITDESGKLGTISYSLNPLYAALLIEDDEAARYFCEQGVDIMSQSDIICTINDTWEGGGYNMGIIEIWGYLFYKSWLEKCPGIQCELLEECYKKGSKQEKIDMLCNMQNTISYYKPYDVKKRVTEKFERECPTIYKDMIKRESHMRISLENLPSDFIGKMLCEAKNKMEVYLFLMSAYVSNLHEEIRRRDTREYREYKDLHLDGDKGTTFLKNVWRDDGVTETIERIYEAEYTDSAETQKVKFIRLSKSLKMMRELADDSLYLEILLNVWEQERKGNEDRHIKLVQTLIKNMDDGEGKLKRMYTEEVFPLVRIYLEQFIFMKNEIYPKNQIDIDIKGLKNMSVPRILTNEEKGSFSYYSQLEKINDRNNKTMRRIWREAHFIIKREKNLYEYQKMIISECEEDDIIMAQKCGLLPAKVMKSAIEYARKNNCIKALPLLLWFESKEAGNGD